MPDVRKNQERHSDAGRTLRTALVGAGGICETHIRALQRLASVEVIGVADLDVDRARAIAERFGLPRAFASLDELLDQRPDVVHVLTPPQAHAENVLKALAGGCHVFVEKPLATSLEDCDRIAAAAVQADREVCVGHSLLRDPFVARALEVVRAGVIGDVVAVDHFRSQKYPPYLGGPIPYQYQDGGFPFRDLGVHSLYLIEAFLGSISGASLQLGPASRDGCPRFKEWRVLLQCARGSGHIYYSWEVTPPQDLLVVHGTRGVLRADMMGMAVTVRPKRRLPGSAERIVNAVAEGATTITQVTGSVWRIARKKLRRYHGLQDLVADFYSAMRAGEPAPVSIVSGRQIVRWTEQIARQADQAKRDYESGFSAGGSAKVLVTGGTGFIGNHLLRRLLEEKGRVRMLVRRRPAEDLMADDRVEVVLGNLGCPADVDRAVQGIDEVYHLGATIEGHVEDFQCATVGGTRNIVDSCLKHGVDRLIYMSSLSVIHAAAARDEKPVDESFPLEPHADQRGLYTQSKLVAEQIVTAAVADRGLRAVILRPGEVLGPDKIFLSGAVGREAAGRVLVLGNGKSPVPVIWVDDLVEAILAAAGIDSFDGRIFHLVDPHEVTQDELARGYLQAIGRRPRLTHVPNFVLWPAAAALEIALGLLNRQSPITPYRLKSATGSRRFDCSAAREVLGWAPHVGIEAGMNHWIDGHRHIPRSAAMEPCVG